jgi:hypothetical protein
MSFFREGLHGRPTYFDKQSKDSKKFGNKSTHVFFFHLDGSRIKSDATSKSSNH